ncbi:unnamed protein product [Arctogadus glacialis]
MQSRLTQYMSRPITPQRPKTPDEQLEKMVVWDLQPFSFVEDRGFMAFTKALNLFYILPEVTTLTHEEWEAIEEACEEVTVEISGEG